MKYCPYCGEELLNDEVSFCSECGQSIAKEHSAPKKSKNVKPAKENVKKKRKKKHKKATEDSSVSPADDGYDGYYDDVLPPDIGRVKEGMDKELVKKIAALGAVVVLIIGLCVAMMYVL